MSWLIWLIVGVAIGCIFSIPITAWVKDKAHKASLLAKEIETKAGNALHHDKNKV